MTVYASKSEQKRVEAGIIERLKRQLRASGKSAFKAGFRAASVDYSVGIEESWHAYQRRDLELDKDLEP